MAPLAASPRLNAISSTADFFITDLSQRWRDGSSFNVCSVLGLATAPGPIRRIGLLDAAAFLDQLLDGSSDRHRQARLVGHFGNDLHILQRPEERHVFPV